MTRTATLTPAQQRIWLRIHVLWYLLANVAQVVTWWAATPDKFFWPLWSIVAWGIGLGFHVWAVRRFVPAT
ncbi:2TM domain-containing protein [Actinoplanes sp. RD1]|uniref:2TM domain-containing protein n=1 Tax=Actinoplanes sp. RD1 TaxID=3064538 RepID=UPI002741BC14|nr:2TM domain-containing protein [Actinoplanes sp. RD1]